MTWVEWLPLILFILFFVLLRVVMRRLGWPT
jgi:hypothetical protein